MRKKEYRNLNKEIRSESVLVEKRKNDSKVDVQTRGGRGCTSHIHGGPLDTVSRSPYG